MPLQLLAEATESHCWAGLLQMVQGHLRLTVRGLPVADSVMADFVCWRPNGWPGTQSEENSRFLEPPLLSAGGKAARWFPPQNA